MERVPTEQQCALLLLRLIDHRQQERDSRITRLGLTELTLKRLWQCPRLTPAFLAGVERWLLRAGWAIVFADDIYGVIRVSAVRHWPRVSSKRMQSELVAFGAGKLDLAKFEYLFDDLNDSDADEVDEDVPAPSRSKPKRRRTKRS